MTRSSTASDHDATHRKAFGPDARIYATRTYIDHGRARSSLAGRRAGVPGPRGRCIPCGLRDPAGHGRRGGRDTGHVRSRIRALGSVRRNRSLTAWLHGIVSNAALDALRRRRVRRLAAPAVGRLVRHRLTPVPIRRTRLRRATSSRRLAGSIPMSGPSSCSATTTATTTPRSARSSGPVPGTSGRSSVARMRPSAAEWRPPRPFQPPTPPTAGAPPDDSR